MSRKIIIIGLLLMLSLFLFAQEKVTLDFLVQKAMERSLSIEGELLQYKNQQSSYKQSFYSWLPSADLRASKSWINEDWQNLSGGFSASWGINSNDGRYFDMKRQMIEMMNSDLSLEDVKKNIAYNVLSSYIDVLSGNDLVKLQREVVALEEKKYQRIETLQKLGEVNDLDLQQSEIDKIQAEISLNNLLLSVENKRADLFYYIGCDDSGAELEDLDMEINTQPGEYQPNLQYQIQEQSLKSTKLMQEQTSMELLPTLSLNWSYSRSSTDGITDFYLYSENAEVSLMVSYPIFGFLDNYQNLQIIKRQYEYNQRKLADQQLSDIKDLNSLNKTLESRTRNYRLYQLKADLAENVLARAQVEYEQGTINLLDYNDYQNKLYNARKNEISEHYRLLETQESINLLLSKKILGKW
ncbi:MAG: TolC family protein [Candidatus Stygibacter australis]|nr:TolC family protein [Candidatus Stygibacter australis]MDP8320927.1 TolC family protein [Candidatus Stygibacter australis]